MTTNDLTQLRTVIKEEISASEQSLKRDLFATEKRLREELTTNDKGLRNELSLLEQRLKKEISDSDKRVMVDIGSFMEDNLFPLIGEKADKADIDKVVTKLDRVIDTNLDHERRIKDVEAVPIIAHQIRKQ